MKRLLRAIERFGTDHGLEQVDVTVELVDGARHRLASLTPEPGFGFLTLVPVLEEDDVPRALVVPIGAVKVVEISAPDPEAPFGFAVVDAGAG